MILTEGGIDLDYTDIIKKAVEFIHRRYNAPITIYDVANHVYLSPSYLATVFRTLTGYTMKNYMLRYRLYRTAMELKNNDKRIVEITYENGFCSQQALTKSFSQFYGISPAQFRRMNPKIDPFPPENLLMERGTFMDLKKMFDNVKFVKKDDFFVVGLETDIDYNRGTGNIGTLWDQWYGEKSIEKIPDQIYDAVSYGMTHSETANNTGKYIAAVEVSALANIPAGFVGRKFGACEYAVIDCTLMELWTGQVIQYFLKTFLKEQNLSQPDAVTLSHGVKSHSFPLFEVYGKNWTWEKKETELIQIYAPISRV